MAALRGTVRTRILCTWRVHDELVTARLPSGIRPWTLGEQALLSLCYSDVRRLRPRGMPGVLGFDFQYLALRTIVENPFEHSGTNRAVYVFGAYSDRRLAGLGSGLAYGLPLQPADICVEATPSGALIRCASEDGTFIVKLGRECPTSSAFDDGTHARDVLLGTPVGLVATPDRQRLRVLEQTFSPVEFDFLAIERGASDYPSAIPSTATADHALFAKEVEYQYGACARTRAIPAGSRERVSGAGSVTRPR